MMNVGLTRKCLVSSGYPKYITQIHRNIPAFPHIDEV
jgi:hypothetical protein